MAGITLQKFVEVSDFLAVNEVSGKSQIYAKGGGELALSLTRQPSRFVHDFLERKGFVLVDGDYIYRPRR